MQPVDKPISIKAAGRVIKIYHDPVVHHGERCDAGVNCKCKKYDSFVVTYCVGTKRVRVRRSTLANAKLKATELREQFQNEDLDALLLSGKDRRAFITAKEYLGDTPLDCAARDFAVAQERLRGMGLDILQAVGLLLELTKRNQGVSLFTAVDFYVQHGSPSTSNKAVNEVVDELLVGLEADGRGEYHLRDLRLRLKRFADAFPEPIGNLTQPRLEGWLRDLRKRNGERPSAKTRNNYRDVLLQLFHFAKQNAYLPKTLPTAAEGLKRVVETSGENHILTPEELRKILAHAKPAVLPGLIIKAFAGLRTEEAAKLDWQHVNLEKQAILLPACLTKLKTRRVVELSANLCAWLRPFNGLKGPVCGAYTMSQSVYKRWQRVAQKANLSLGANRLRNSYIAYHLALHNDIAFTAQQSGNSPNVIQREYLELTTKVDAEEWFRIGPTNEQLTGIKAWVERELILQKERISHGLPASGI